MRYLLSFLLIFAVFGVALAADAPLKAGDIDPKSGKKIKYWVAPMDPTYIRYEPGKSPMGMDLVPVFEEEGEKEPTSTIRIDPVTMQNMGVRLGEVKVQPLSRSIRALGTVTYDETLIYTVNTKFNGWIEKLFVKFEGEHVAAQQPMFDLYSPELYAAQQEYLLALKHYAQLKGSAIPHLAQNAARLLNATRKRLKLWDLSDGQINTLNRKGAAGKTVTVFSPAKGVVIKKNAFEGHYVKAGEHQYEIADLSRVWVDVEIYEYELPYVKVGMEAEMELSYIPDKRFKGKVLFVYPFLSPETRTVRLRLDFENPDLILKPNMYANVYLHSKIAQNAIVIPQEAVINSGERMLVFLSRGKGKFEPREVQLGVEGENDLVQVLNGVREGDKIVLSAQFLMDSESRLREAIQKMLEVRSGGADSSADDLNMDDMQMDDMGMDDMSMDDMQMDDLKMDEPAGTPEQ